jgi:hypothetical protein
MLAVEVDGEPRYLLDPEYQRRHRWSKARKSRLIESFLMNVPVPPVFLYERDFARFEVMDGRQRLTAIREFYENKLALEGLEYWPELHGRTYRNLPDKVRDGIDRRYLSSIILLQESASAEDEAARLKKMVFERLNSGGVRLEPQETRNAVYDGPLNQLCIELSENPRFRSMWRIPDDPVVEEDGDDDKPTGGIELFRKMGDVELVLRFFAYRQMAVFGGGLNRINDLLDRFLIEGNKFGEELLARYRRLFHSTIDLLWDLRGKDAFCRVDGKGKPAKILYDPIMFVASQHVADHAKLKAAKTEFARLLAELYARPDSPFLGRATNSSDVRKRNDLMKELFVSVLKPKRRT